MSPPLSRDYLPPRKAAPLMYVDNSTVICEVTDLASLRAGEHLLCPLNVFRGLGFPRIDWVVDTMCQLGNFYYFHHFVLLDDVVSIRDGVAFRKDGQEAEVGEYTNTAGEFLEKTRKVGFCGAFFDKASFKICKLSNYKGAVFYRVIEEKMPSSEIKKVQTKAREAAKDGKVFTSEESYNMLLRNCEHAVSELKGRGRFSSQVSFVYWNSFRVLLQLIGLACLWGLDSNHYWFLAAVGYYSLTLAPVVLQSIGVFIKACMAICKLRSKGILNGRKFCHLMSKELCRMIFVGTCAGYVIGVMPRTIWDDAKRKRDRFLLACISLFAFIVFNSLYNLFATIAVKIIISCRRRPDFFSPRETHSTTARSKAEAFLKKSQ